MINICLQKIRSIPLSLWIGMAVFGTMFALISLVNHHLYRTSALDLGMMNHALHSFSEFRANTFTLCLSESEEKPFFGTHLSPVMFLFVPVYWVLKGTSLLYIQIAAILLGGLGIFCIAQSATKDNKIALWAAGHFYCIWGIYSALEFDFHNNVIGAMMVPWLWHFLTERRRIAALATLLLILACQENMGLWMVFVITGFMIHKKSLLQRKSLHFEWPLALLSGFYFVLAVAWIMPSIAGEIHSSQLSRYSHLGDGIANIAWHLVTHPFEAVKQLFTCQHPDASAKLEFHVMMLVAGGWACVRYPQFLWMLIPIYAQKLLSNAPSFWGVGRQYSIEFVPIISLAVLTLGMNHRRTFRVLYPLICVVTLTSTILKFKQRKDFFKRECIDLLYAPHYKTSLDVSAIQRVVSAIPEDIPLSVSSSLAPHLANRACIRLFPMEKDAEMIVLLDNPGYEWPLNEVRFQDELQRLKSSNRYELIAEDSDIWVFQVVE